MENEQIPRHVAIIMDGNGRWAKKRGLERVEGHKAGADAVERILEASKKFGIRYLTFYAFSTENWKRSAEEVGALMELLTMFLHEKCETLIKNRIRLLVTGRLDGMPEEPRKALKEVIRKTSEHYDYTLILALNYGGRAEIADAAKQIASDAAAGKIKPEQVDESLFSKYLYQPEVPDPDLMIRTSGEMRLSNFLLWELSYSELYVTDVLWPDFGEKELAEALESYASRDRRFGGRK